MNASTVRVLRWGALAVSAAAALGTGYPSAREDAAPAIRIGTLDLVRVFDEHPALRRGKEELRAQRDSTQARLRDEERRLQSMEAEAAMLDAASEAYREKREALEVGRLQFRHLVAREDASLQRANVELLRTAHAEVEEAVEKVAKERGLTLVFQRSEFPFGGENEEELFSKIAVRGVLYSDARFDVTADVLERLAAKGAKP